MPKLIATLFNVYSHESTQTEFYISESDNIGLSAVAAWRQEGCAVPSTLDRQIFEHSKPIGNTGLLITKGTYGRKFFDQFTLPSDIVIIWEPA